jgi:hypothetical protein
MFAATAAIFTQLLFLPKWQSQGPTFGAATIEIVFGCKKN